MSVETDVAQPDPLVVLRQIFARIVENGISGAPDLEIEPARAPSQVPVVFACREATIAA
ncbi:MAG: hypothetical protein HYY18_15195 [Planctomycetes bacterium]|nr:hypothetical protein [Planctomycetota bacterium]